MRPFRHRLRQLEDGSFRCLDCDFVSTSDDPKNLWAGTRGAQVGAWGHERETSVFKLWDGTAGKTTALGRVVHVSVGVGAAVAVIVLVVAIARWEPPPDEPSSGPVNIEGVSGCDIGDCDSNGAPDDLEGRIEQDIEREHLSEVASDYCPQVDDMTYESCVEGVLSGDIVVDPDAPPIPTSDDLGAYP